MKYFLDTEFLEGPQKEKFPISLFRKNTPPTIDLISIGIVSEDGREYYAISKDFNLKEAWNRCDIKTMTNLKGDSDTNKMKVYWIRENVLKPIWKDLYQRNFGVVRQIQVMIGNYDSNFNFKSLKNLINKYGKNNKQIAKEIISFTEPLDRFYSLKGEKRFTNGSVAIGKPAKKDLKKLRKYDMKYYYPSSKPQFYAYYADYDWVVFCQLFGKMMDLPNGFPKYCKDLKQILDEKPLTHKVVTGHVDGKYIAGADPYYSTWKEHRDYPKQENEHNALADARWNKKLHEFLYTI